ncbi:MAG: damage-control phosphatase ARMT1 family protein [Promethearchaeota archaeon]
MNIQVDCIPCLVGQVLKAVRLTRPGTPPAKIREIMADVMAFLSRPDVLEIHAPVVGKTVYGLVNQHLGTDDAYRELKAAQNEHAIEYLPAIRRFLEHAQANGVDPLRAVVTVAITGNIIDLGAPTKIDVEAEIEALVHRKLDLDDFDSLRHDLETAREVLLIADNAGEIVFDKVLVEYLLDNFGGGRGPLERLVVAVRGGPIINDATLEDARAISLTETCEVVESTASPGVILEEASEEFLQVYESADVVVAKGQGNFEALSGEDVRSGAGKPLYFLLKSKCHVMERLLGVPVGGLVLKKR